jgi:hypothetical protein
MHNVAERAFSARLLKSSVHAITVAAAIAVVPTTVVLASGAANAASRTYYVDPQGSDSAAGTSPDHAWRTLSRIPGSLNAGDKVLLRRGATFTDDLTISASGSSGAPITLGAYGAGRRPMLTKHNCLTVSGSYVAVVSIRTSRCAWAGMTLSGSHDTVIDSRSSRNVTGVFIRPSAQHARVTGSFVNHNRRMSVNTPGGDDDSGAFGVLVQGDYSTIDHNHINGQHAFSYDYGVDGAAVEIYGAQHTSIHHNTARNNEAFTELGNPRSAHTTYAYNAITSDLKTSEFLVTRGANSSWGPVADTNVVHNSVRLTGSASQGFVCYDGCSSGILSLRDNVMAATGKVGYADHAFDTADNIFWGGPVQFQKDSSDRIVSPQFATGDSANVSLSANSPAIDKGKASIWSTDVDGRSTPVDGNGDGVSSADVGAFELH